MISAGVLSVEEDMKFSALVLSKHPRSAETFAHRCHLNDLYTKRNLFSLFLVRFNITRKDSKYK